MQLPNFRLCIFLNLYSPPSLKKISMKILIDIPDKKASFFLELLQNFKFVKAQQLTSQSAEVLKDLKEAVEEVNEIKTGKKKARPLIEFLNEL